MRRLMDGVLDRYGTMATLHSATGRREVKVFFHSINSTSWQNMERVFCQLGEIPRGQYICVLPADAGAMPEDTLQVWNKSYLLRRVEQMLLGDENVYCWALCVEKGGDEAWGSN